MQSSNKKQQAELSDDEISSEEEGEDLILEGVLIRNQEVASSSSSEEGSDDDDDDDDDDDGDHDEHNGRNEGPKKKKAKVEKNGNKQNSSSSTTTNTSSKKKNETKNTKAKKKEKKNEPEIVNLEFTFNDMKDAYFHGIKNFLTNQPAYASNSSALSDLIIENISVGTVVSTEDGEDNVFGFASVLNVTTYKDKPCMKLLKQKIIESCPGKHKVEMETVLSGTTKRPAGIFLHGRMVNLPLEITLILHEQLVQDMDWAVDHAEGGEEERKSLNFGAFVILAPCTRDGASHSTIYKNFDDEVFSGNAEFTFPMDLSKLRRKGEGRSKTENEGDSDHVDVIVLTKDGHRTAMKELKTMIQV
eukprot:CAMPEP_0203668424 /NCGR_PEP_ID=MMETSP0090-20130426/5049_1 /ASSEMBLY_ACC=CAM_ASM_001088 /TAXON_ID=426623 /ORGANISM="Chaetoceros affinis, Strain CCMP159" /LENGTH=358 /DNA_ID=CAMNT_0050532861 /DNA_START=26 /DNA_END=1102 /DNA_ORIENTATION=+